MSYDATVLADGPFCYLDGTFISGQLIDVVNGLNFDYVGTPGIGLPGQIPGNGAIDTTNGYFEHPNGIFTDQFGGNSVDEWTLEAWVQVPAGFDPAGSGIITEDYGDHGDFNVAYFLGTGGNNGSSEWQAGQYYGGWYWTAQGAWPDLSRGDWHHVVGTNNLTDGYSLYFDGVLVNSSLGYRVTPPMNDLWTYLGRRHDTGQPNDQWPGLIDRPAIYDFALTASQVAAHYAAGTSTGTTVSPSSIGSSEAWGSSTVTRGPVDVALSGIGSSEAWGTASVVPGAISAAPSGIGSSEAWGASIVSAGAALIVPAGVASSEAWGTAQLQPGPVTAQPAGIGSSETWGATQAQPGPVAVSPTGIGSSQAWGTQTVVPAGNSLFPAGIVSSEGWGSVAVVPAPVNVQPAGIGTSEVWGATSVVLAVNLAGAGIGTTEAWGQPALGSLYPIPLAGIGSSEAWGAAQVTTGPVAVQPAGIPSSATWGQAVLDASVTVLAAGWGTAEQWGQPDLRLLAGLFSIPGSETWGAAALVVGPVTVLAAGIAPSEQWGGPLVTTGYRVIQAGHFTRSAPGHSGDAPGRFILGGGPARPVLD